MGAGRGGWRPPPLLESLTLTAQARLNIRRETRLCRAGFAKIAFPRHRRASILKESPRSRLEAGRSDSLTSTRGQRLRLTAGTFRIYRLYPPAIPRAELRSLTRLSQGPLFGVCMSGNGTLTHSEGVCRVFAVADCALPQRGIIAQRRPAVV